MTKESFHRLQKPQIFPMQKYILKLPKGVDTNVWLSCFLYQMLCLIYDYGFYCFACNVKKLISLRNYYQVLTNYYEHDKIGTSALRYCSWVKFYFG